MKILVILSLLCILGISTVFSADIVELNCESIENDRIRHFSLNGSVALDNGDWESVGPVLMTTRNPGKNSSITIQNVYFDGEYNVYLPGELAKSEVIKLDYLNTFGQFVRAQLLINHPGPLSSTIRFKDGQTYRSRCSFR